MTVAGAESFVPEERDLDTLAKAAETCHGCDLFRDADQTVFGAGRPSARMMLVGEQPGDQEDRAGRPFVGPAGRVLAKALDAAAVEHETLYVTNAVKHFKFVRAERGQRRIHKTPSRTEVVACRPWLLAELETVDPSVVVLLGATAAKSLLGNDFRLTAHRREVLSPPSDLGWPSLNAKLLVTVHPSSILRGPSDGRDAAFDGLVADLRFAAEMLDGP
jgi:uracil-DNA glycosylase family protein